MGAFMAEHGIEPDLVLCSPAVRTRQTLDLVLPYLAGPAVVYEEAFYLAAASQLLARVRRIRSQGPPCHDRLATIPACTAWLWSWRVPVRPRPMQALAVKFPTGGLAVLDFESGRLGDGRAGGRDSCGLFMAPKRLP